MSSKGIISERRRETRREASRRSTQRDSFYVHMGKQNITTCEILTLAIWFIEQKFIFFFDLELISVMKRPGPDRPDPAR